MNTQELRTNNPGFSKDNATAYSLDAYSTPDRWYGLGYELQYDFLAFFDNIPDPVGQKKFLYKLKDVFVKSFVMTEDHFRFWRWVDDGGVNLMYRIFGISPEEEAKKQPFKFVIIVYHDKRPFDLRVLKDLEDGINEIALSNNVRVELTRLLIIPRSEETIQAKIHNEINENKFN